MGALSRMKSKGSFSYMVALMALLRATNPSCIGIRRGAKDGSHADVPASANPVFYYDLLAQFLRKELADNPGDGVVGTSGRE